MTLGCLTEAETAEPRSRADPRVAGASRDRDAILLFKHNLFANAFYLGSYAVELGLKACIARRAAWWAAEGHAQYLFATVVASLIMAGFVLLHHVTIDRTVLPPEDHPVARTVELNLIHLHTAATEFRHTVRLYLFAHDRKLAGKDDLWRMIAWINIAGRNGSIVAYGIHMVMQAINSVNAPALTKMVDMNERGQATKLFTAEFPNIAGIRKSAAHPGELSATEKELDKHRLKEAMVSGLGVIGAGGYVTGGMVAGDDHLIYTASFEGKPVEYELSMRKADVLEKVAQHYSRAFYPLGTPTMSAPTRHPGSASSA